MFSDFAFILYGKKKERRLDVRRWSRLTVGPLWQISGISSTQSLCVWVMRTIIIIIIICFHVGSFVLPLSPGFFFFFFIFCLTRPQIIGTPESNKTNARSSLLSPLTRSDAKQIDKYIMKQRKKRDTNSNDIVYFD